MRFDIITIFPKILDSYFNESLLKKARKKGLISIQAHNLRDFTDDKHKKVDDTPYGGGPGIVLKIEPIIKAIAFAKRQAKSDKRKVKTILFSLRGKKFDQKEAHRLAKYKQLIFICGIYEGVDERVAKYISDDEMSVGDYILSGGELAAAVVIEAVSRLIPGVLGKTESLEEIKGSYPVYTKPEIIKLKVRSEKLSGAKSALGGSRVLKVPPILLSGNHKEIEKWRNKYSSQ